MPQSGWHAWGTVRRATGSLSPVLHRSHATYEIARAWQRVAQGPAAIESLWDVLHADPEVTGAVVAWCLERPEEASATEMDSGDGRRSVSPLIPLRRHVLCVGLNYHAHVTEGAPIVGRSADRLEERIYFSKSVTSIIGPTDTIDAHADVTKRLDYEVELAAVIGRRGSSIPRAEALDHVFGYAILNDVSARDLQSARKQWYEGKSLDGTSPFGPWIVPVDVVGDPQALRLHLAVNGETRQEATTRDMIYSVAEIISDLSRGHTLDVGDVIATGTPSGCGFALDPPRFLQPGDVVDATIDGLGSQRNAVV